MGILWNTRLCRRLAVARRAHGSRARHGASSTGRPCHSSQPSPLLPTAFHKLRLDGVLARKLTFRDSVRRGNSVPANELPGYMEIVYVIRVSVWSAVACYPSASKLAHSTWCRRRGHRDAPREQPHNRANARHSILLLIRGSFLSSFPRRRESRAWVAVLVFLGQRHPQPRAPDRGRQKPLRTNNRYPVNPVYPCLRFNSDGQDMQDSHEMGNCAISKYHHEFREFLENATGSVVR
jgi:hypothetical protein